MVSFQVGHAQSARGWARAKTKASMPKSTFKLRTLILLAPLLAPRQAAG
jgi:hypothetical protein